MKTVVALYDHISDANAAVRDLVDFGISRDNISLMANDVSGNYSSYLSGNTGPAVSAQPVESTASGAATGAGIGAIIGGLGGLLVGLGVLVIPGVGPVLAAGPLATAISALTGAGVGAMAGGAAGGLIGALVDLGLPEETAGNYAEGVKRGGILVTVRAEDNQAEDVRRIMNRHNVVNLDDRVRGWRDQGWTGYNANSPVGSYGTPSDIHSSDTTMGTTGTRYDDRFNQYDPSFQQDYTTTYGNRGHDYNYYRPAYYYGYQLANEDRYRDYSWDQLEPDARREWEAGGHQGAWEDFKDAVHNAWMRVKQGARDVTGANATHNYADTTSGSYRSDMGTGRSYDERFYNYDTDFQQNYNTNYANRGYSYDYYQPAYYYGYQLASDDRYHDWTWQDLEPEARRQWETGGHQGAWEDFKDSVRYAWERVKTGVRQTFD